MMIISMYVKLKHDDENLKITLVFDMILARVLKVRCEGVEVVNRNRS